MGEKSNQKNHDLAGWEYGLAGAYSGIVTRFLCQPLDVLKIRFQLQTTSVKNKDTAKYKSLIQTLRLMAVEEGISSLWKGHCAAQILSVSYSTMHLSSYELISNLARKSWPDRPQWADHLVASACGTSAGVLATVVSFPFDVIRTHLVYQGEPKVYKGVLDAATQIYHKDGTYGFRKGMLAAVVQNAPMSGLTFSFKGIFREIWLWLFSDNDKTNSSLPTSGIVITSLLAGICAKTVVYPFDLMKKRLQVQGFDKNKSFCPQMIKCTGIAQCFTITVEREGFFGLFKGLQASVLKAGASTAIYFTMYEHACSFISHTKR